MRSLAPMLVVLVLAAPASAQERPRDQMVPITLPTPPSALVNSHVLYLNNCRPNGCTVTSGTTDSRTDHSDIAHGHLSALASNVSWDSVKSCITTIMAPFNITVTDVDPGTAEHFEIMIGKRRRRIGHTPNPDQLIGAGKAAIDEIELQTADMGDTLRAREVLAAAPELGLGTPARRDVANGRDRDRAIRSVIGAKADLDREFGAVLAQCPKLDPRPHRTRAR